VEVGKTYKGIVKKIVEFGAFVGVMPNQDGLLHISEIAHERVNVVTDFLKEGDEVEVKVIDVDKSGKIRLSRKALLPMPEGMQSRPSGGGDRGPRGGHPGGGGRGPGGPRGDRPRGPAPAQGGRQD
jgi:polyribonucleotide nucleotidyltransferase